MEKPGPTPAAFRSTLLTAKSITLSPAWELISRPRELKLSSRSPIITTQYRIAGNSCQLEVGFTISQDGGKTWTAGKHLAGPMKLDWIAPSDNGQMVADYISSSYTDGKPYGVFAVATPPSGGLLNEAMYTTKDPLLVPADEPRFSSRGEKPVA